MVLHLSFSVIDHTLFVGQHQQHKKNCYFKSLEPVKIPFDGLHNNCIECFWLKITKTLYQKYENNIIRLPIIN